MSLKMVNRKFWPKELSTCQRARVIILRNSLALKWTRFLPSLPYLALLVRMPRLIVSIGRTNITERRRRSKSMNSPSSSKLSKSRSLQRNWNFSRIPVTMNNGVNDILVLCKRMRNLEWTSKMLKSSHTPKMTFRN